MDNERYHDMIQVMKTAAAVDEVPPKFWCDLTADIEMRWLRLLSG